MRIAVLSDIHGNLTALEAVLADIRQTAPDLVFHGGDLADGGSRPGEVIDHIRDLGWQGVVGNGDQMLCRSESLEEFAAQSAAPPEMWRCVREMAAATRTMTGSERLSWLEKLPMAISRPELALVHATPQSCWKAAPTNASDEELCQVYGELQRKIVVLGHVHIPCVRTLSGIPGMVINTGSVGLPFDGDPRSSYLLLDDGQPFIRRVDYNVDREAKILLSSKIPHADWTIRMLRSSSPQLP